MQKKRKRDKEETLHTGKMHNRRWILATINFCINNIASEYLQKFVEKHACQ